MLAMDIVDTIRRRERLLQRELDAEVREEDLKERRARNSIRSNAAMLLPRKPPTRPARPASPEV